MLNNSQKSNNSDNKKTSVKGYELGPLLSIPLDRYSSSEQFSPIRINSVFDDPQYPRKGEEIFKNPKITQNEVRNQLKRIHSFSNERRIDNSPLYKESYRCRENENSFSPQISPMKLEKGAHFNLQLRELPNEISNSQEHRVFEIQTELKNQKALFKLCLKLFCGEEIQAEDLNLSAHELNILNFILKRKFGKNFKQRELCLDNVDKLLPLSAIVKANPLKRPEECYKFVFTRVLKIMRKNFRNQFNIKKDLEEKFNEYYFGSIAEQEKIDLKEFNYPLTAEPGPKGKSTLNARYFELIKRSGQFVSQFTSIANKEIPHECRKEVMFKMETLLMKWDSQLSENKSIEFKMLEIKSYLVKNKHCKLPWTIMEVHDSIQKCNRVLGDDK